MYRFLLRWLPPTLADFCMVVWYLMLIIEIYRLFFVGSGEFRYLNI